jgi:hypothetical protein
MCIVPGAFLVIREDFVCGSYFGEECGGAFDVAIVPVGMQFERFLAIRLLESGTLLGLMMVLWSSINTLVLCGCPIYLQ